MTPAQQWRDTLRESLLAARKARDTTRVAALRCALSAIDNAETPDAVTLDGRTDGPVAGALSGLGAGEVARRELTDVEIRDLIQHEIDERLAAADQYTAGGHHPQAADLRSQAEVLTQALGDV